MYLYSFFSVNHLFSNLYQLLPKTHFYRLFVVSLNFLEDNIVTFLILYFKLYSSTPSSEKFDRMKIKIRHRQMAKAFKNILLINSRTTKIRALIQQPVYDFIIDLYLKLLHFFELFVITHPNFIIVQSRI